MTEHPEPNALKKAEPWLRGKAQWIARSDLPVETDEEWADSVEWILFRLKEAYCEGYADRLKDEVAESKPPEPKRRVQRRKK